MAKAAQPTDDSSTSATLLAKLRTSDDASAWREFARRYARLIWWFGKDAGLSSQDAEDLVQEVLTDFARQAATFDYDPAKGRFRGLLRTIAQRRVIDMLRRKKLPLEGDRTLERLETPQLVQHEWDRLEGTALVLQSLEGVAREVEPVTYQSFQLHVLEEWPVRRVAGFLGISEESVYAAKSRVLARLRRLVAEGSDGDSRHE
jgi:RNA polymerase sigma-70 factor (ECF subfamily)